MTSHDAVLILNALAVSTPEYEMLSAEYAAILSDSVDGTEVPDGLSMAALDLFRQIPEAKEKIERYAENLSHMQSYGLEDLLTPQFFLIVLVLLSVYGGIEYKEGKWKFRAGYKPLNAKALKPVLSIVAAAIGTAGRGLVELSEKMGGEEKNDSED